LNAGKDNDVQKVNQTVTRLGRDLKNDEVTDGGQIK